MSERAGRPRLRPPTLFPRPRPSLDRKCARAKDETTRQRKLSIVGCSLRDILKKDMPEIKNCASPSPPFCRYPCARAHPATANQSKGQAFLIHAFMTILICPLPLPPLSTLLIFLRSHGATSIVLKHFETLGNENSCKYWQNRPLAASAEEPAGTRASSMSDWAT